MPGKPRASQAKNTAHRNRRVCYAVAMSLDGYIAGLNGEFDWIVMDPDVDFDAMNSRFDTTIMGRRTYEVMKGAGGGGSSPGMQVFVCSRTLRQSDHPGVTIVDNAEVLVAELRSKPGKDVWLFGGGSLFRSLAERGLVDTVEVGVFPVLLGGGVPLLATPASRVRLKFTGHQRYAKTGTVSLEYEVLLERPRKRRKPG